VEINFLRGADLRNDALIHNDDLIRQGHGLRLIVGDINGGDADLLLDAADLSTHGNTQLGIQVGEGFIKEQDTGLHHQSTGQGHTLLLAAGKLVGHAAFHAGELHQIEDAHDFFTDLLLGEVAQLKAIGNIIEHIIVRQQSVALEHHGGIALIGGQLIDGLAAEVDLAGIGAFKARDHAQRGGLAAAGGTQQGDKAARRNIEVGIMDGVEVLAGFRILIDLGDIFEADAFFHFFHQSVTSFIFLLVPKCLMKVFMSRTEP